MISEETKNKIIEAYTTPGHPTAYGGIQQVHSYYKTHTNLKLKLIDVKNILSSVKSYTLHKQYKRLKRNNTYVHESRQMFQIDLAHVQELAPYNDGFKYLLNCIDCFTRFAFVRPLLDKTADSFLTAFKSILKQARVKPKFIVSDRGSEMVNQLFINYCRAEGMILMHNYTSTHAHIVERFNGTLKKLMYKHMNQTGSFRYIDVLQDLVETYNKRKHRMINMCPYTAEIPRNAFKIRYRMSKYYAKTEKQKPTLAIGDKVRIQLKKTKFSRGHHVTSSNEVYTVYHVKTTLPIPIYYVQDEKGMKKRGGYYAFELTKVT